VLLVFVFLFRLIDPNMLKAWAAYMMSTLTLRGWLWYMFSNSSPTRDTARRWEYAAAAAGFLTGLGWAALNGPLYPPPPQGTAHTVILLATVAVAFSAAMFDGISRLTFWSVLAPTLLPTILRAGYEATSPLDTTMLAVIVMVGVVLTVQASQYRILLENLRRRIESEALLAEQQAIFQSATAGIAVLCDGRVVKCNPRLGELLGRRLGELTGGTLNEFFVSLPELERLLQDSAAAFQHGRTHHGIVRLRRSDGSEFWAEFSGSALRDGGESGCSVWLISEATTAGVRRPAP
jgi:PAS domain S-box-containing protein